MSAVTAKPGLFQLPGCDQHFDWTPGPSRCCSAETFVVIRYGDHDGDETTAIVCPRCRLLTTGRREWVVAIGTFDLMAGEYRPLATPESVSPGDLARFAF